jgi:hypothetical protein
VLNAKNGSVDKNREKIQPKTRNTKNLYNNLLTKKTKQKSYNIENCKWLRIKQNFTNMLKMIIVE